jgi:sugar/nucleoside kinase (ribokinase family)
MKTAESKPSIAFGCDLTVNVYPQRMRATYGGSSLGDAISARREGANVSIVAPIGDYPNGNRFISYCKANDVDTHQIRILEGLTPKIDISINTFNEQKYDKWEYGVAPSYHFGKKEFSWFRKQDAVVLVAHAPTIHLLDELADERRSGKNISPDGKTIYVIDFDDLTQFGKDVHSIEQYLDIFDIFVFYLDKEKDGEIVRDLERLAGESRKLFIITLGAQGTEARKGNEAYGYYGLAVPALNTAEARNFHLAAFLVSYLKTHDILKSLETGGVSASKTV